MKVAGEPKDSAVEKTPKPKLVDLPGEGEGDEPPAYEVTSSGGTGRSASTAATAGTDSTTKTDTTASSGARGLREIVQSPPPTPDSDVLLPPSEGLPGSHHPDASQHTIVPPPPDPSDIRDQLLALAKQQNEDDHARDLIDLRALMREAIATANDAEMITVLQVKREEMPEALKTLQRALEKEQERERDESATVDELTGAGEEPTEAMSDTEGKVTRRNSQTSALGLRGIPGIPGLSRRRTGASSKSKDSRKKNGSERGATSTASAVTEDDGSGKGSGWSRSTNSSESGRDTLDREFIESGIDALRRLSTSRGQDINLPNWTITRYATLSSYLIRDIIDNGFLVLKSILTLASGWDISLTSIKLNGGDLQLQ